MICIKISFLSQNRSEPSFHGWRRTRYVLPGAGAEKKNLEPGPRKNSLELRKNGSAQKNLRRPLTTLPIIYLYSLLFNSKLNLIFEVFFLKVILLKIVLTKLLRYIFFTCISGCPPPPGSRSKWRKIGTRIRIRIIIDADKKTLHVDD